VGQGGPGHRVGPADVHVHEQVEPVDRQVRDPRQLDRAGVVDQQVQVAEFLDGFGDDALAVVRVAHVADRLGCLVDRPLQIRVGVVDGLAGRDHVRTVLGERQRQRLADPSRRPGDEGHGAREVGVGFVGHDHPS